MSDRRGRKGIMIIGCILGLLTPMMLIWIQLDSSISPFWYYAGSAINGVVNWMAIATSSLSDVIPKEYRASSFALLIAGFSLGFAFSPAISLFLDDNLTTSIMSFALMLLALLINVIWFPETLQTPNIVEHASNNIFMRPFQEMIILNRDNLFRLLSALAFFSGMVGSADQSLLVYYVEDQLDFNKTDISKMFVILGICGIVIQGLLIKPFISLLGERLVLVVAFSFGVLCNVLYGISKTKQMIFVALVFSSFCGMSFPTISAIKSNNVNEFEQGRIQGALFSLQALAYGIGPVFLRFVYSRTKDYLPGSMFLFAAALELAAVAFAYLLPKDRANSKRRGHSTPSQHD